MQGPVAACPCYEPDSSKKKIVPKAVSDTKIYKFGHKQKKNDLI